MNVVFRIAAATKPWKEFASKLNCRSRRTGHRSSALRISLYTPSNSRHRSAHRLMKDFQRKRAEVRRLKVLIAEPYIIPLLVTRKWLDDVSRSCVLI